MSKFQITNINIINNHPQPSTMTIINNIPIPISKIKKMAMMGS